MNLIRQCVQKDGCAQIVLQLLSDILALHCRVPLVKQLRFDLGLQAPLVDIILELEILVEHLGHRCPLTAHLFVELVLFSLKFVFNELLLELYEALTIKFHLLL